MQHDEIIWSVVGNNFCSYKVKAETQTFCKNRFNVTGLCSRRACPLANSKYATIIEENGRLYLFSKVVERAHQPARLWERRKLPRSYREALKTIDTELEYWPQFLKHKCKQRLTKLTEMIIRARRVKLKAENEELIPIQKKVERRDKTREAKALSAAQIERNVEKELLFRLHEGAYDGIYNLEQAPFEQTLGEMEEEIETDDELLENEEFLENDPFDDIDLGNDDGSVDIEDLVDDGKSRTRKRSTPSSQSRTKTKRSREREEELDDELDKAVVSE